LRAGHGGRCRDGLAYAGEQPEAVGVVGLGGLGGWRGFQGEW
jgi:hypothetical protein